MTNTWRWKVCISEGVEWHRPGIQMPQYLPNGTEIEAPAEDVAQISYALLRGDIVA